MRPHLLEINAFGPFAGTVTVDLDDLGDSGLLLLHGETGAGKTSVLDALGYALYGDVPGDRGIRGLRSEHAGAVDETWVRLTFSAGGRRLRIRRSPEQSVPKQRGGGVTTRRASVLLEELGPDGLTVALATRLDEAGLMVGDLVGMSAAQFFQVVLLPQGRFAAFLQAPAAQRQVLLQQLFGTERFSDVEAALKRRRDDLRAELDILSHDRDAAVGLLGHVSLTMPELTPSGPGSSADWAHSRLVSLAAGAEAAEAAAERAEAAELAARAALDLATRVVERRRRWLTLLARQAELAASSDQADLLRARLLNARRAAPLAGDIGRLLGLRAQVSGLSDAAAGAREQLARAALDCPLAGLAAAAGADPVVVERSARDALAAVLPVLAVEQALVARAAEVARASAAVVDAEQRHVAAAAARDDLRARQARLAESLAADEATVTGLAALSLAADEARARAEAAAQLPAARAMQVEAETLLQDGRAAANDAREHWLDLRTRRLRGIAAELAAELVDGEPCSVCGGVDHPHPADHRADAVTEAAEAAAHEASDAAEAALEPLREAVGVASTVVAELATRAGDALVDVETIAAQLTSLQRLAAGLAARRAELEQLADAVDAAAASVTATEERLTAARTVAAALTGSVDEQVAQVDGARGPAASVAERVRQLETLVTAAATAVSAEAALSSVTSEVGRLESELATGAALAGFDALDAVVQAVLPDAEFGEAEALLRSHDDEAAAVREALADPELADVPADDVDLPAAQAAFDEARAAVAAALAERADATSRAHQASGLAARIVACEAELAPVRARHDEVAALAELAAGGAGNRLRMSLTSFVLAARLEQVAARASVRLARMTSGRFTLQHSDEVLDGRQKSGLGLAVHDVWTGTQRPTSSLSGGESFMTALSLALGLSDVVAEEAGGRRIDALFVDEGFGTLDEAALDRVMEVLDTLRDGGRLVGVVSHVEELQRRVPARLEVVRTETGSWLRPHHAPVGG